MNERDRLFHLNELKSDECFCGGPKKKFKSFCFKCYTTLPSDMQKDLYQPFNQGYQEAYDRAVKWLDANEH